MARDSGDPSAGRHWAEAGLALYRKLDDARGIAYALLWLGLNTADERAFEEAQQLFGESAERFGELGDDYFALYATRMLAWMYDALGDRGRARELHEANLRQARALHARDLEASVLGALADYAADEGRVQDAAAMSAESIRIFLDLGRPAGVAHELCRGAAALALAGEAVLATRLLACSAAFHEEAGIMMLPHLVLENERTLTKIRAQLDEAAFDAAWEQGGRLTVEEAAAPALESLRSVAAGARS
jgi:tetratricopeptide (TPR) repeat protein